ncbi:RNA polymerase sigma factor [Alicyclobacillaceae bacterium I2511]|nr:RNA polymerase sigma factor [Alicyclobacillaceae bacterium I2511]
MDEQDLRLIRAAKRGDTEAFTTLVRNYKHYVYRTAAGVLRPGPDAEDAVQETFVKAFTSLRNLKEERTFPTWLATIAVRTSLNLLQKRKRFEAAVRDEDKLYTAAVPDPTGRVDTTLDLAAALARLSPEHRVILVLRELDGLDYKEIADVLDIPLGTVRSRLHAARLQLRSVWDGERGDSE